MRAFDMTAKQALGPAFIGAIGVVFGDIGTSPLYAFKEAFSGSHALSLSHDNVLAVLSMMFWAVTGPTASTVPATSMPRTPCPRSTGR